MNQTSKIIAAVVLVAVVAGGVLLFTQKDKSAAPASKSSESSSSSNSGAEETAAATITYDGSGFSPASVTVKSGDTVKVVNQSQDQIKFESNPHPTHTDNRELNQEFIDAGASKSFKVTKVGTWGYHNHLNHEQGGTIIVQ